MTITRVQGDGSTNGHAVGSGSSISPSMTNTPASGNVLIATIGISDYNGAVTVSSISQTNVAWTKQKSINGYPYGDGHFWLDSEIWLGVVGSGASKNITVNLSGTPSYASVANICEYSGVATSSFLDQTASNFAISNPKIMDTGTTSATTQANELWIGSVAAEAYGNLSNPANGFTLLDGVQVSPNLGNAYLEKIVSSTGTASSSVDDPDSIDGFAGCIATFFASGGGGAPTAWIQF